MDCAHCTMKWPRLHRDHLHDDEPNKPCRSSEEHVHLYPEPSGKRPYIDRSNHG